eukprot:GFUD01001920.1.p1 GENE.GFUD01001920.1~~GFUD01001920.1.p1  ORF type:complete len:554 (-),score=124.25 GFUD01001920.1:32-1693(-)
MTARLVCLLLPSVAISQYEPVKVSEILNNFLFPSNELVGGFERMVDGLHQLDDKHLSCGKRQVCEAFSVGAAIERSDGTFDFEKGLLRKIVDGTGEVIFDIARPFLETFGLGRVARREVSFTSFLIDMLDSAIIGISRVLAGRRFSRQIEAASPVASFLIEPASAILRAIPTTYYGNILDLAVDMTGIANRRSGAYGLMRSGGLGYFYGGGDKSVCKSLHSDLLNDNAYCDNEGGNYPLAMLNPINQHQLGKTVRIGGDGINPLMDRTHNPNAMQQASFEWTDLLEPTKMMCKVDNYMKAVQGHIDVTTDPDLAPQFISQTDLEIQGEYENVVEVRKHDEVVSFKDLDLEEQHFVERMRLYEKMKSAPEEGMLAISRKPTSRDKFVTYCQEENRKEVEKILKSKNITVAMDDTDYIIEEGSGDIETQTIISVRKVKSQESIEKSLYDLEIVARLGDHSLLSEKLDVEDGSEFFAVQSLVNSFNVDANGKIERVVKIDSKKGIPTLLIQFDSTEYRDAVLKSSRSPDARSSTSARLRRPKVKDLKHVVSLVTNH